MPLKIQKPKGRKYWYITGSVAGIRVRESTKTASKAVAESIRIKRESELEQSRVYGPQSVATFAQAVNLYLDRGGEARYLGAILDRFGHLRLADISQRDLDAGAREIYPDAKVSTLNRQAYTPFIAVMNEAAINDLAPYRKWRRPAGHGEKGVTPWLWPHEFELLYRMIHEPTRPLIVFLAGVGCRISTAAQLDWSTVDLSGAQAWLWDEKRDQEYRVELPARVVAELANLPEKTGKVFSVNSCRKPVETAARRAGLSIKQPQHIFRHTWATWFYGQTRDVVRLKALGNWKSNEWERYVKIAPDRISEGLLAHGWDFERRTDQETTVTELSQL